MNTRKTPVIYIGLVIVLVVLVNVLSNRFNLRIDLTEDNRYTLSKATKDILRNLDEPVTVKAYFTSEGLPPQYLKVRRDFKELLIEYNKISGGDLVYEFIDPSEGESVEQEAMQNGIQPVIVQVREKDQLKQQRAFMGAIISMGSQKEVIPFMDNNAPMEYALTTSIKKVSVVNKPLIGIIGGHEEPSLAEMQEAVYSLEVLYNLEEITLSDTLDFMKYQAMAWINPQEVVDPAELAILDQYLAQGGKLFLAFNTVKHDFNTSQAELLETGIDTWLSEKGLIVEKNALVDAQCVNVSVRQQRGPFVMNVPVPFPYIPQVSNFADHVITKGMELMVLPMVSTMSYVGDSTKKFTPLVFSSNKANTKTVPLFFDVNRNWTDQDFPLSNVALGGILSGKLSGNLESQMVVIADGDFPVNGEGANAQQLQPDNISLFVNSIDWLADDTGLIDLRTKGVSSRPLDEMDDSKKQWLKWFNFFLPILLILAFGFYRSQVNKNKRMRRMERGSLG